MIGLKYIAVFFMILIVTCNGKKSKEDDSKGLLSGIAGMASNAFAKMLPNPKHSFCLNLATSVIQPPPKSPPSDCDLDTSSKVKAATDAYIYYIGKACDDSPKFQSILSRSITLSTSLSVIREVMFQYADRLKLENPEADIDEILTKAYNGIPDIYPASSLFYSYSVALGVKSAQNGDLTSENAAQYACDFVQKILKSYDSMSCFGDESDYVEGYIKGFFNFCVKDNIEGQDLKDAAEMFNKNYKCRNPQ